MKLAYLVHPHLGGTYTVFRHLRSGLAPAGIEVRWLGAGPGACAAFADPAWADERPCGSVAESRPDADEKALGLALLRTIALERFDGVFVNVLTSRAEMNVARYLPAATKRIMVVHNITPGTYAAARAIRDHVHATVGVSPRVRNDLVGRHGFGPSRTFAVPNAVDLRAASSLPRVPGGPLRLIYLGRIEDAAKGVFQLPRILDGLDPAAATLTIAGDGPDLPALRARCSRLGSRAGFVGKIQPEQVPGLLAAHDVLIMPSRFEGFGLTLVEAMAAGCVPVVTGIRGVTDTIVMDGRDGFLFAPGNVGEACHAVKRLSADRGMLRQMSAARARGGARLLRRTHGGGLPRGDLRRPGRIRPPGKAARPSSMAAAPGNASWPAHVRPGAGEEPAARRARAGGRSVITGLHPFGGGAGTSGSLPPGDAALPGAAAGYPSIGTGRFRPSPHPLANRLARAGWGVAWTLLFRPTPRLLTGWRRFLLRAFGARIGRGAVVHASARIWAPWNLEMGICSCLGERVDCYSVAPVRIGAYATVSQYSILCTASHDPDSADMTLTSSPILIGDHAWVAASAFVGPGVAIGEGAVLGARSSAFRSVPPWMIVVGSPARSIRPRSRTVAEHRQRLGGVV